MYERTTNSGGAVVWEPGDEKLAVNAMELTPETGVPTHVVLPDESNVPVDADVARGVRQAYRWLQFIVENSDDDPEAFDDRDAVQARYDELKAELEAEQTQDDGTA